MGRFRKRIGHSLRQRPRLYKLLYDTYKHNVFRRVTANLRDLPDFAIIGAQKAGTTSLYNFITKHPAIAPASIKEVEYFSMRYSLGESWYRSNFPMDLSRHRLAKKINQKIITGEASPYYLFHPTAPNRMKDLLPDAKLIVILRNPVDRAYSHYHHAVKRRMHTETLSFEDAIRLEEKRCAGERDRIIKDPHFVPKYYRTHSYLARGIYVDQLENWFKYYSKENFLFLTTEDIRDNNQQVLDQMFDFLGVTPFQINKIKEFNVGYYKEMNESTRRNLIEYFKPHNERLSKILQRSFDWDRYHSHSSSSSSSFPPPPCNHLC